MSWFKDRFGLDTRSLAVFRVGLAILMLADLLVRCTDIEAFYSDFGVLPRATFIENFLNRNHFSIYLASGSTYFQSILMAVHGFFAVLMLVGYRSRLATVVCWFFLVSLQVRNPYVLQGGDVLFRLLVFWGIFLPLGAKWSVDAALSKVEGQETPNTIFSGASVALLIQVCIVYWATMLLRQSSDWGADSTAVHYAMHLDHFAKPLAVWIRQYPTLTAVLTVMTHWVYGIATALAVFGGVKGPYRTAAVVAMVGVHLIFHFGLAIGLFPFISAVSWLVLTPSWVWDKLEKLSIRRVPRKASIIVPKGNRAALVWSHIMQTFLMLKKVTIEEQKDAQWEVICCEERHSRANGLIPLFKASPLFWVFTPVVRWLGSLNERCYQAIVTRSGWAWRFVSHLRFRPIPIKIHWMTQVLVLTLLVYIVAWNVGTLKKNTTLVWGDTSVSFSPPRLPSDYKSVGSAIRIDQRWGMFSPKPLRSDGWFMIPATLADGTTFDLFKDGEPITWEKPEWVKDTYKNQRWRKYSMNLRRKEYKKHRSNYGSYLCRKWNRGVPKEKKIKQLNILYMQEVTLADGAGPIECINLWTHWCTPGAKKLKPQYRNQCDRVSAIGSAKRLAREACLCSRWDNEKRRERCITHLEKRHKNLKKKWVNPLLTKQEKSTINEALGSFQSCVQKISPTKLTLLDHLQED